MEQEQIQEYGRLQNDVTAKLRQHAFVDDRNARHVFQYLILPSFTPSIAWDVFRRQRVRHEDDLVLVRSSWRSDSDAEKLRTPVERLRHPFPLIPTVEVHQLKVSSSELASLATELAALEVRIGAARSVSGVDGVTYEVAIEQPPHHIALSAKCRLSWWHTPPKEWPGLAAWVQRAEAVFGSAWAPATMPCRRHFKSRRSTIPRHEMKRSDCSTRVITGESVSCLPRSVRAKN